MNEDSLLDTIAHALRAQERAAGVAECAAFLEANERKRLDREEKDAAALRLECLRLAVRLRAGLGGVSHEDVLGIATDFERHVAGRKD